LIETYILRMKKLVKAGKANMLLCENEKHINRFINLKTRVIDYCEILDIIYGLEFNVEEFKKGYKGNGKLKNAINDVYHFLLSRKSKKLDKIKERTFDQITDRIYNNLEDLDARVGLK